jgi:methyl acetate hydrolase
MNTETIDAVLRTAVTGGAVPDVVAMVAVREGTIYEGAAGSRVADGEEPVSADTHDRIMSMTKMVATVAALQQVERGVLDLDAPVQEYCPEFGDLKVLDGFDGETPRLRPPASRATVKQLVTHTSGLGYRFFDDDLLRWEAATAPFVTPEVYQVYPDVCIRTSRPRCTPRSDRSGGRPQRRGAHPAPQNSRRGGAP